MKARIRKTGEIVTIITYSVGDYTKKIRCPDLDRVSYIDSSGIEHCQAKMHIDWDFEKIEDNRVITTIETMIAMYKKDLEGQDSCSYGYSEIYHKKSALIELLNIITK